MLWLNLLKPELTRKDDMHTETLKKLAEAMGYEATKQGKEVELIECGQGFKDMNIGVENMEEVILNRAEGGEKRPPLLRVNENPVLRWNVASVRLLEDPAGNRKFTKAKATGRIDGVVALAMAMAKKDAVEVPGFITESLITI